MIHLCQYLCQLMKEKAMKNNEITQRGNMYYANFTLKGKRCRMKLASDEETALLRLNLIKVEMLSPQVTLTTKPKKKRMDYITACNLFVKSAYRVENVWTLPYNKKFHQDHHQLIH